MKTLLVSVDFSNATRAVLSTAADLATAADSRIILHHSVIPTIIPTDYGLGMEVLPANLELAEKNARAQLAHLHDELVARGLHTTISVTYGSAADDIVEEAVRLQVDGIVLGSHGHTAFYDLVVGSTTHSVVKNAPCPVVIVPRARTA